jgi:hypothetical protein
VAEPVKAYDSLGDKVLVPADKVAELEAMGGRVASDEEVAESTLQQRYAALPTAAKVVGPLVGQGLPPTLEAWREGASAGLTAGVDKVVTKEALDAVKPGAGKAYAEHVGDLKTAHGAAYGAGEVGGMVAGAAIGGAAGAGKGAATGLARLLPSAAIDAAGGAAEGLASRGLAGLAGRGAVGRAIATGGRFAARGAVEGALQGAAGQLTEDMLGDHEVTGEKLFAAMGSGLVAGGVTGGVLGAGGSLAASGARAGAKGLAGLVRRGAGELGAAVGQAGGASGLIRSQANDLAFRSLGGTPSRTAKTLGKVSEQEVGAWTLKNAIAEAPEGAGALRAAYEAGATGRSDELLVRISEKNRQTGEAIGELLQKNPIPVQVREFDDAAAKIVVELQKDAATFGAGSTVLNAAENMKAALTNRGSLAEGTVNLADAYRQRASLEGLAYELKSQGRNVERDALKSWLREVDGILVGKLDDGAAAELKALKRDYQVGRIAEDIAEQGAARFKGNNLVSLTTGLAAAGALAGAGPIGAVATLAAGTLLKQRGAAAGAGLLGKLSELQTVAAAVQRIDAKISGAARAAMADVPTGKPRPVLPREQVRARAEKTAAAVREYQRDPEAFRARVMRTAEDLSRSAPNVAQHYLTTTMRAASILSARIPPPPTVGPLDQPLPMRPEDAVAVNAVAEYTERPEAFFDDVAAGTVTSEQVAVARELMPQAFAELQDLVRTSVAERRAKGRPIPRKQRFRLGTLLGVPLDWDLEPANLAVLQQTATAPQQEPQTPTKPSSDSSSTAQLGQLDRIESS